MSLLELWNSLVDLPAVIGVCLLLLIAVTIWVISFYTIRGAMRSALRVHERAAGARERTSGHAPAHPQSTVG